MKYESNTAVIVGASLSGLMSALALSRIGMKVIMLERSAQKSRSGSALPVSDGLIQRLTGRHFAEDILPPGPQAWADVYAGLHAVASSDPNIDIHTSLRVKEIGQCEQSIWALTDNGETFSGCLLVGADGHASVVRRHIDPEHPDATFAGYLIWLGVVEESELSSPPWPDGLAILDARGYCLNAYYLPGADGSVAVGRRRLGFGWYDASQNDLLKATGALIGEVVQRTLRPVDIPESIFQKLEKEARSIWPDPWREAILSCLGRREIIGTPIGEYMPRRLVRGRICMVGDAAHVPSPMTGRGFDESARDALSLAEEVKKGKYNIADALQRYETNRLDTARELVRSGYRFSHSFTAK
ncbi:FAD-dependent monooxygenase [Ewingella americana]|uniref:FAD-dependent monooxygenase n=1 Tax=Ewingella americana TaxID=41202 RepID=UPI00191EE78A|nr:FAD-dependent monooxygenase [Ewingella americana]